MRAGRLRHSVYIQSKANVRTSAGGFTETWSTDATVWAGIEPLRGREYFENAQVKGDATHRIVLRYRGSVTPDNRIVHIEDSRTFQILEVLNPSERDVSLEIMAKESL